GLAFLQDYHNGDFDQDFGVYEPPILDILESIEADDQGLLQEMVEMATMFSLTNNEAFLSCLLEFSPTSP
ncbi:hypothetical protein HDU81_011126, partial [Chytriomyces hyalinus]